MTPDTSVQWLSQEVPSLEGSLYISPNCTAAVASKTLSLASQAREHALPRIGSGATAAVYRDGNEAVKIHLIDEYFPSYGLQDLQINVGLSTGLQKVPEFTDLSTDKTYTYKGPEYHCAFLPDAIGKISKPVWVMSYEPGYTPESNQELPPIEQRRQHFSNAVRMLGFKPDTIEFDDEPQNTIIQDTPVKGGLSRCYVKLDAYAAFM